MSSSTAPAPATRREPAANDAKPGVAGHYLPDRAPRKDRVPGPRAAWLLAAVFVLAVVCCASLAVGARGLSLETVWQALTQFNPADGDHAVVHARIPRTVLGLLA